MWTITEVLCQEVVVCSCRFLMLEFYLVVVAVLIDVVAVGFLVIFLVVHFVVLKFVVEMALFYGVLTQVVVYVVLFVVLIVLYFQKPMHPRLQRQRTHLILSYLYC